TYLVATAAKTTVLQTGTPAALESRGPAARSGSGLRVVGLTRPILDLTDVAAVCERFRRDRPELIIHCAALTRAVLCEQDPALARKINVEVTRLVVDLAADVNFSGKGRIDGKSTRLNFSHVAISCDAHCRRTKPYLQ